MLNIAVHLNTNVTELESCLKSFTHKEYAIANQSWNLNNVQTILVKVKLHQDFLCLFRKYTYNISGGVKHFMHSDSPFLLASCASNSEHDPCMGGNL